VQRWIGTAVATPTSPKIIVYAAIGLLDAEGDAMDVVNSFQATVTFAQVTGIVKGRLVRTLWLVGGTSCG
jgi:hypothetical protein